jgi:K+-transporting ATPase A subunit
MTEATHRLTRLDLIGAGQANILVFPVLAVAVAAILLWRWPRLRTRNQEIAFFAIAVLGTAINNIVPPLLYS